MVKAALIVRSLLASLLFALSALNALYASAQQPAQAADSASARTARPLWSELSPKQQAVLAPLAAEWETLDSTRRKKWVAIANRYPQMKPDEQQRLQNRMREWVSLTPAQRRVARENYEAFKQLPRSQRGEVKQKWEQQQSASPADAATDAQTNAPAK